MTAQAAALCAHDPYNWTAGCPVCEPAPGLLDITATTATTATSNTHSIADPAPDASPVRGPSSWFDRVNTLPTRAAVQGRPPSPNLATFLAGPEDEPTRLVPGVLDLGERVILTGAEGRGKSTLLRQVGVQIAAGVHPFTLGRVEPRRVLLIDLENGERHLRRQFRPLVLAAGGVEKVPGLHIEVRPEGLDVLDSQDAGWLRQVVAANRPDLLIIGPIYKLVGGDPREEGPARQAARLLDELRTRHQCAVMIEAHSPYASNGGRRPERPYGASLWSRWPEFGLHLADDGRLSHWRGARDQRDWPAALRRGGPWPWSPVTDHRHLLWARIVEVTTQAGEHLAVRDLAELVGASRSTVQRLLDEHRAEYNALAGGAG